MIKNLTVLILGAGASHDFGFPIGWDLKNEIISDLRSAGGDRLRYLHELKYTNDEIEVFANDLEGSPYRSVDRFLEQHDNEDYLNLGKACIAACLMKREIPETFYRRNNEPLHSWYALLFEKLDEAADWETIGENRLKIITFNYDRSFEQYLFTALQRSFGKTEKEAAEKMKYFPILHVHGQLGHLPWEGKGPARPYSREVSAELIREFSPMIKIIHEQEYRSRKLSLAREWLTDAVHINFLGFGFDRQNLERIKFDSQSKYVNGTCYDLSPHERQQALNSLGAICGNSATLGLSKNLDHDIYKFLRNEPWSS